MLASSPHYDNKLIVLVAVQRVSTQLHFLDYEGKGRIVDPLTSVEKLQVGQNVLIVVAFVKEMEIKG